MRKVACGQQGLLVSRLGLGCMGMSASYGPVDEAAALDTLYLALERGLTFWDTADVYGQGQNERLLSRVLRQERSRVELASKCGIAGRTAEGLALNGRPEAIHQACRASLQRLQVETLDLLYLHRVDPDVPVEESVGAMGELVSQGYVRFLGLSEASSQTIRRAHREFPLSAVQSEYSLFSREVERDVLPTLRELGIGLVPYSPLGRGLLAGALSAEAPLSEGDFRAQLPRFSESHLPQNLRLVDTVKAVAKAHGCSPAQLALAWVLAQGDDVIPIPGTVKTRHLLENLESVEVSLSEQGLQALDHLSAQVQGARYPDALLKAVGR